MGTHKGFIIVLILILTLSSLLMVRPEHASAQTYKEVNGIISSNITLTKANGPYQFEQVAVNSGATLTIESGSTVKIEGYLQVKGTLIAKGINNNQIYISGGSIAFTSTSTANSLIENANLFWVSVSISSSVTIKNSFLQGTQDTSTLSISSGSPTISHNTLKGTLDSTSVVSVTGGSPTISNNNIISFVDNGLYPNPPPGMNRFGSEYGVYASDVNGASITNNNFYLPFRTASVKVASGTAAVGGNTEYPNESVAYPTSTPLPLTPTPVPTPTLPPYPPSPTTSPTLNAETTNSPIETPNSPSSEGSLYGTIIVVIIASVVINALLVTVVALLLKKRRKS